MDIHKNVLTLFLIISISFFNDLCTAENPGPLLSFNGQHDIVIQPSAEASSGETYLQGVLLPKTTVKVTVDLKNIQNASFVIFQVHSYVQQLVLSSAVHSEAHNSVKGTDIGLYTKLMTGNGTVDYFIFNPSNEAVDILLIPVFYSHDDPIPGGCNLSLLVNIAPFMTLTFDPTYNIVQVDAQAASASEENCQPSGLAYEVYELFTSDVTSDAYFDAIRSVITADEAAFKGLPSPKPIRQPELRRRFAAYPRFGSVYVVTVRNLKTGKRSAYVPISNFNCIDGNIGDCAYYNNIVNTVWVSVAVSGAYLLTELRYIIGRRGVYYGMRLLFIVASVTVLFPLVPSYLGILLLFTLSVGLPILICKSETASTLLISNFERGYMLIVDCFYAVVPSHFAFGMSIPGIMYWLSNVQNQFTIILVFLVLYLFFSSVYHLSRGDHGLDPLCGNFFMIMLVSYAANGVILHVFTDPARILQSDLSHVMFYPPGKLIDQILLSLWLFVSFAYLPLRKSLREKFSTGEYQVIINDAPGPSPTYNT